MLAAAEARLGPLRHQLRDGARHLAGAKVLAERLYGAGPITALALACWLGGAGRFSSSAKAVRFTGLDVTVHSSDRKGPPGRLSRQGPPVPRWAVSEAGKAHARASAPGHGCYAQVKDRTNGKRAALSAPPCRRPARSSGRRAASWPSSAATRSPPPDSPTAHGGHAGDAPGPGQERPAATLTRGGTTAASSRRAAASRCRSRAHGQAGGLIRLSGRIPAGGDTAG